MKYHHTTTYRAEKMTVGALIDILHSPHPWPWTHFLHGDFGEPIGIHRGGDWLASRRRNEKITALAEEGESGKFEEDGDAI